MITASRIVSYMIIVTLRNLRGEGLFNLGKGLGRKYCETHCYELVMTHNRSQFLFCVDSYWWRPQQILSNPKLNRDISPELYYPANVSAIVRIRFGCELQKTPKWRWLNYDRSLFLLLRSPESVSWGLVGALQCQDPGSFYLITPPSLALDFHLMFQDGCLRSSHHVCILVSREEEGIKKGTFSFQGHFLAVAHTTAAYILWAVT